jgi:hypothetical protein
MKESVRRLIHASGWAKIEKSIGLVEIVLKNKGKQSLVQRGSMEIEKLMKSLSPSIYPKI